MRQSTPWRRPDTERALRAGQCACLFSRGEPERQGSVVMRADAPEGAHTWKVLRTTSRHALITAQECSVFYWYLGIEWAGQFAHPMGSSSFSETLTMGAVTLSDISFLSVKEIWSLHRSFLLGRHTHSFGPCGRSTNGYRGDSEKEWEQRPSHRTGAASI